ncbi:hypothetical protein FFLO_02745 [Filobasidium floriforme]|uniref:Uncharacterized protein n=1 Tax=Filobasidium floriforme TaxID=5210 RepID=A0A8K0NRI8_9TREE|nr:uncharacterized protein HD553DRAFT_357654 [Filobasidium floriforme]KAG7561844.1 hypothetical protein FFLO_02745 [Filobasidium floriforme]KAH8083243.1 hypothetical protein HD553DRAFT_357654 [Filobasidium floriforme]
MVYRLSFAQAFTVLATLALSSTQASAAILRERQDAPAAPAAPDISNISNNQAQTYHFDGLDQESEIADIKNETAGLDLFYIREQALSIATFPSANTEDWFWFFAKTRIAVDPTRGPGPGCQVALYYDNIKQRFDLAKENNFASAGDSPWHMPSAMSPWCSGNTDRQEVIKNDNYATEQYGYKTIRPATDPAHHALIVLLSGLGWDTAVENVNATNMEAIPSSEQVFGENGQIAAEDKDNFQSKLLAAITEKQHNIVPNPYKYPKGDMKWAKKREAILNTLSNSATNGTDPAASSGPVTEVTATNTAETQTGVPTAEVITTTDGAGLVVTTTLAATATDTGPVVVKPVTTIFGAPPADASQVTDDAQASGADVVDSTTITDTDTAAQATATREAVVDTASGSIATSDEPTATEVTIEASGTTITGTTAAETQSLT